MGVGVIKGVWGWVIDAGVCGGCVLQSYAMICHAKVR